MIFTAGILFSGLLGSYLYYKKDNFAYSIISLYTTIENKLYRGDTSNHKPVFYSIDLENKEIFQTTTLEKLTFCFEEKKMRFYAEPRSSYKDVLLAYVSIDIKIDNKTYINEFEVTDFFNKLQVHEDDPLDFRNSLLWFLIFKEFISLKSHSLNIEDDYKEVIIDYTIIDMEGEEHKLNSFILQSCEDGNVKIIE